MNAQPRWLPPLLFPFVTLAGCVQYGSPVALKAASGAEIIETSKASDWHTLDPENLLYVDLPNGRVVIELAPDFAPKHVANIRALAREHYYDNLPIVRVQDNYVVQWGDPNDEDAAKKRPIRTAQSALAPEFTRPSKDLPFTALPDADTYAQVAGFAGDFPAARDASGRAWLTHCYAAVGVGRGLDVGSGSGAELYVVIGQAPRHLDRNITLVGRVVQGMDLLSPLPRGKGQLGFYTDAKQYTPIKTIRVGADVPAEQRVPLEMLRTDTKTFEAFIEARRNRREAFFIEPAGHVDVCNVPLPVREVSSP